VGTATATEEEEPVALEVRQPRHDLEVLQVKEPPADPERAEHDLPMGRRRPPNPSDSRGKSVVGASICAWEEADVLPCGRRCCSPLRRCRCCPPLLLSFSPTAGALRIERTCSRSPRRGGRAASPNLGAAIVGGEGELGDTEL
jgi:hypothetical protein